MAQQYGEGVAEALAKRREELALEALSATNRLSRYAPYICVYSLVSFVVWALAWFYLQPNCAAPVFSPAEEEAFGGYCYAFAGAFAASFVFQMMQLFDSSVKGSVRAAPVYCTAVINLVSLCTYIALAHGMFPIVISASGRITHVIRWGQWISIGPVLIVMMQSLDIRNQSDTNFLFFSVFIQVLALIFGFAGAYRVVKAAMMGAYDDKSPLQQMISTKLQQKDAENKKYKAVDESDPSSIKTNHNDKGGKDSGGIKETDDILVAVKNVGVIIASKLALYCAVTWLLMLVVTVLAHRHRISHFHEALLHSVLDILDKCLYVRVLCSGHGTAVSPEGLLTRMLILEERANASIRLFMRFIFHEVSSPLNSINLGLEFLKDETMDFEDKDTLNTVIVSTEEIKNVLEMFRAQKTVTANLYAKMKPINLKELIREIATKHVDVADSVDVSLLLALDPRIPEVLMGNEAGLRTAINSFILNGISQASKPGGKATVLAELKSKTNMGARGEKVTVHFTVKDDGPGLSESEIDMMFVPFSRLKPGNAKSSADKFSLSAAKQILEVSGAKVGGESAPGKGSSFYFHIDFHRPSQADEQANFLTTEILSVNEEASKVGSPVVSKPRVPEWASSQSKGATRASLSITATQVASADSSHVTREEKVALIESTPNPAGETEPLIASKKPVALLVDDVKSNRRMYGRILELLGFDVVTADDGLECIAAVHAATEPFTLLLVDHSMPNMTGGDAVAQLRSENYEGKIIGLAGADDSHEVFKESGADTVIDKPLETAKLRAVIESIGVHCES